MNRILLVEDHERLAQLVSSGLHAAGIAVDTVQRIDAAWSALQQVSYGALVLDRGLPDGEGLTLLKRLRDSELSIPCLVLSATHSTLIQMEAILRGE
ncbi:MAG: response regulator transcription factor [Oxalobacteraceae bacterium]|nr:MAG: response regulator transcription factor [Oxalobacteraceae bacterium]